MSMGMNGSRDPQPPLANGWEAVLGIAALCAFVLAAGALGGLGASGALLGGGWVWPTGSTHAEVLGGLLTGEPGRGLDAGQRALLPSPAWAYAGVVAGELVTLAVASTLAVVLWRQRRPNDGRRGMATRSEAAQVLGAGKVRASRAQIRPDLYGRGAGEGQC